MVWFETIGMIILHFYKGYNLQPRENKWIHHEASQAEITIHLYNAAASDNLASSSAYRPEIFGNAIKFHTIIQRDGLTSWELSVYIGKQFFFIVPQDSIYNNPDKKDGGVIAIIDVKKGEDDDNETFALRI